MDFNKIKEKLNKNYEEFRTSLIVQLNNSKEDAHIIRHMMDDGKIDKREAEAIKRLLTDVFKSVGLGALFALPGGSLLTPILVKIFTYLQIEVMPSGFARVKPKQIELSCMVCSEKFMGDEPETCCSGRDCGCMGMPIDPIICSEECYNNLPHMKGRTKSESENETTA